MNFKEYTSENQHCLTIDEGLALWEITERKKLFKKQVSDTHIQLIILSGEMQVKIDGTNYSLKANHFADILMTKFSLIDVSKNIHAYVLLLTEEYVSNLLKNRPPFPINYVMQIRKNPVLTMTSEQTKLLGIRIGMLKEILTGYSHYFRLEMIKCASWMLLLEVANIFFTQNSPSENNQDYTRKRAIFMQFIKLLPQHIKKEHSVIYYATQLCITPQYLERIVNECSKRTVFQWIRETIMEETSALLKDTDKTIQQISDEYGFPDQSTFTKYYKHYSGKTPGAFRKKNY
jgi:AraC family transcriptional regulator, transcriptional activator of pobA